VLTKAASELGLRVREAQGGVAGEPLRPVRLGLFDVFGGHMPTGWDQWLLQEFGFPVQQVWGDRVEAGDLRRDFDVLVFHTGLPGPRDLQRAARDLDLREALRLVALQLGDVGERDRVAGRHARRRSQRDRVREGRGRARECGGKREEDESGDAHGWVRVVASAVHADWITSGDW
jgi:hypothetical protein